MTDSKYCDRNLFLFSHVPNLGGLKLLQLLPECIFLYMKMNIIIYYKFTLFYTEKLICGKILSYGTKNIFHHSLTFLTRKCLE